MKRWIRRLCALLLCAVLTVPALPRAQGATVYFMALNDTFLGVSDTMPTLYNGVLYVPYTLFSPQVTGVNLGVTATYSALRNRVMLFSSQHQLTFDLAEDSTYDLDGNTYSGRAITRNSMVYLPIAQVCAVFSEIKYTVNYTEYGYLVRVKNNKAVLSDPAFINAAQNMMKNALSRYEQEHPDQPPPVVESPPVVVTPAPGVGSGAAVYPGFAPAKASGLENALDVLKKLELPGIFFLTPQQVEQWDDLVRQLVGEGHFVGLVTEAADAETAAADLAAGQKLLAAVAHCRAGAVLAPGLDEAGAEQLEQLGYVCWQTTADGRGLQGSAASRAAALMKSMVSGEAARNYLLLDENYGAVLGQLLDELVNEDYQLRSPVPTEL